MKKERNGNPFKKAGVRLGLVIGIFLLLVLGSAGPYPKLVMDDNRRWHIIWEGSFAEAMELVPIVAGNSSIQMIYIMNSTGTDNNARAENDTYVIQNWCNVSGLLYTNADDTEIDIAHSTNFEIWVNVRGNATHCKRGANWFDSDLRVRITSADLSIGADTVCTNFVTSNNSAFTFLYVNCILTGPYSITKGSTNQITSIKFEAYY